MPDDNEKDMANTLTGIWRQIAVFGVIGVMAAGWLANEFWMRPKQMQEFNAINEREREASRAEVARERQVSRDEAEQSRRHGDRASEGIRKAIEASSDKIDQRHKEMIDVLRKIETKNGLSSSGAPGSGH